MRRPTARQMLNASRVNRIRALEGDRAQLLDLVRRLVGFIDEERIGSTALQLEAEALLARLDGEGRG